jgi:hypothetical protein
MGGHDGIPNTLSPCFYAGRGEEGDGSDPAADEPACSRDRSFAFRKG